MGRRSRRGAVNVEHLGISFHMENRPALDGGFIPFAPWQAAYLAEAHRPVRIAVERQDGQVAVFDTRLRDDAHRAADLRFLERTVKLLLWCVGGWRVRICGCDELTQELARIYSPAGIRAFDADFMETVFQRPFVLEAVSEADLPAPRGGARRIGGHWNGCRIGFDAGGSDRKVSAVIDGETIFSEEVVWLPKVNPDPEYHYQGIVSALKSAAAHMPRVDAVGVSSAGIYINDRTMSASLFLKVPKELYESKVKNIFIRAITDTFGNVPYAVANDGDVSALAGTMSLNDNNVLGIAMGTSEAVGYVNEDGCITGWLNELAFVPVDANPAAMRDEWSGDIGCGVKYFCQDGVNKLAPRAGIKLDENASPAEKLKVAQKLMESDDPRAVQVYESIGTYLGHTLAYYYEHYGFRYVLLLGRVMSGKGGDLLLATCREVLDDEYPEYADKILLTLPDEKFRRVGQSMAAASLPELS